uniref:Uncharacterized protein n=1 Tax=Oryza punctata TaxID=4537 RepID=A0A0E0JZ40_ORYPU
MPSIDRSVGERRTANGGGDLVADWHLSRSIAGILLMVVLVRQPCKMEEGLGCESVHSSIAHQLFDEMSSPLEVFEEDVLLVMCEEKITWDEAMYMLQEELRDAQRRMDEKLD